MEPNEHDQEIGMNIKRYRRKRQMTQKELADKIGKTESSIRKYEKGLVTIPLDVLEEIASALEVTAFDLLQTDRTNAWSKFNEIIDYKKLAKEVEEIEAIEVYLKSIGYTFEIFAFGEDGESALLELSKDGNTVDFTEEEFKDFREHLKESIEYQVWKSNKNKSLPL